MYLSAAEVVFMSEENRSFNGDSRVTNIGRRSKVLLISAIF